MVYYSNVATLSIKSIQNHVLDLPKLHHWTCVIKHEMYYERYYVISLHLMAENKGSGLIGQMCKSAWTLVLALGNIDSVNTAPKWVTQTATFPSKKKRKEKFAGSDFRGWIIMNIEWNFYATSGYRIKTIILN